MSTDPIRSFLVGLDHDALVDLIAEAADHDGALAERIRIRAAMAARAIPGSRS